jgi:hypothetical protein
MTERPFRTGDGARDEAPGASPPGRDRERLG